MKQETDKQKKIIDSSSIQKNQIDKKIREIVNLKDKLFSANEKNKKLEEQNNIIMNEIEKINNKLISVINKIINTNDNNNNDNW